MRGLTLNLLTTTIVGPLSNASKWQMGFNSAFKGLRVGILVRPSVIVRIFTARSSYRADSILRALSVDLQYRVLSK